MPVCAFAESEARRLSVYVLQAHTTHDAVAKFSPEGHLDHKPRFEPCPTQAFGVINAIAIVTQIVPAVTSLGDHCLSVIL
jgi:hypothetical protein